MQEGSPIDSHQEMNQLFGELYRTSTEMEETYFRYATGLLDGLDDREKFEVVVNSSLGITVPTDNTPTTLSVMLLRDGTDVTGGYDDAAFTWERISEDREADAQWRGGVPPVGKTLTVSYEDLVFGYASFLCRFRYQYSESMFYAKSGSIVLSKEVPGPQGEQGEAYVVVIESSNGDVFKPGELMMTTLRARVFLNGEEVTAQLPDSAFKWKRKSYYEPNDDEAWNSAHVAGYRQIDVTADDVSDRATFFCEIVL